MKDYPRIIFFGTPDFAVASLEALIDAGYDVVAVVTAPDKPAGRGMHLSTSAVKRYSLTKGLRLFQPDNLKNDTFQNDLYALNPDLQVVVAFRMLPRMIWSLPPLGTINLHASLLPDYRGAAPINWAIVNGETETGVTTFFIEETIDTGNILFSKKVSIHPEEDAGELHDHLKIIGAEILLSTIEAIINKSVNAVPQVESLSTNLMFRKAPKILKEHCCIHWEYEVEQIYNLIRGMSPYPGAFTELKDKDNQIYYLKVLRAGQELSKHSLFPGQIITDGKNYIKIAALNGFVHLLKVQPAGRKVMNSKEFLNGFGSHFSGNLR